MENTLLFFQRLHLTKGVSDNFGPASLIALNNQDDYPPLVVATAFLN